MDGTDLATSRGWRTTLEQVIRETGDANSADQLETLLEAMDRTIGIIQDDEGLKIISQTRHHHLK